MKNKKQIIMAHRGASGLVEFENTIEAFQKAIDVKADAIECDVRKTKDGMMIITHNPDFENVNICDYTYKELCEATSKKGFIMPTLDETLNFCKGKILVDIELKEEGYEEEFLSDVLKILKYDEFHVRSFNDNSLKIIKKLDKAVTTILLLGFEFPKHGIFTRLGELFPLARILKCKCDMVSPHYRLVILGFAWRMKLLKKDVYVWTVNDIDLMKKMLLKKKVEAIVTNYPDRGREILDNK